MSEHHESLEKIQALFPQHFEKPKIHPSVFIAKGAFVMGAVTLGENSSVWYNAVIRGDMQTITIGTRTNIQDGAVVHVTYPRGSTTIGDDVTVGHGAIIHACTVGNQVLIGMGAILLDGCRIGNQVLIAAGALVPPNAVIPDRSKVIGSPGKVVGQVSDEELKWLQTNAEHYRMVALAHRQSFGSEVPLENRFTFGK